MGCTGVGCTGKDPAAADDSGGGGGGGDDTSDTASEPEPVWEDNRLETSETLTGVYSSGSGVYFSATGGEVWLRQSGEWDDLSVDVDDEDLNGLWATGSGESVGVVAVGDAGWIATLGAGAWAAEDIGTANFEAVNGAAQNALLAVGWGGVYSNASGTWEYQAIEGSPRFNDVWYNGTWGVAVGEEGAIGFIASGVWSVSQHESRTSLYGVWSLGQQNAWAVGADGMVLHWDDTGWTDISPGTTVSLWAVWAPDAANVFVVGSNGTALRYDGATWEELPTGVDHNLYAVSGTTVDNVWASGNRGMALRYGG